MRRSRGIKNRPFPSITAWLVLALVSCISGNFFTGFEDSSISHAIQNKNENWRIDSTRPMIHYEPEIVSTSDFYLREILRQSIAMNRKIDRAMIRLFGSTVKGIDKYENIGKIRYSNFTQANCESLINTDAPSGVYNFPYDDLPKNGGGWLWNIFQIYCDQSYGGGWTVVQRRNNKFRYRVNFTSKSSDDYAKGFGDINSEFWLGNEWIHRLTTEFGPYELRLEFEGSLGHRSRILYSDFTLGSKEDNYRIKIGASGAKNRKDSFVSNDTTTFEDQDWSDGVVDLVDPCEMDFHGTWWFPDDCIGANLNSDLYENTKIMIRSQKHTKLT